MAARGLAIIGVSLDTDREAFERALARAALPWPQLFSSDLPALFHIEGPPASYLLDSSGRIAAKNLSGADLRSGIEELVAVPQLGEIKALESRREKFSRVPDVLEALASKTGDWIADVGAGQGFFAVRLAKAVGATGRVLAVNLDHDQVGLIRQRARLTGLGNIQSVAGQPDDPKLPPGRLDSVLIVNTYHEMDQYESVLSHILLALKPGGRLVVIDPSRPSLRSRSRAEQTAAHELAPEFAEQELRRAGFAIVDRRDSFLPPSKELEDFSGPGAWWMLVACRP